MGIWFSVPSPVRQSVNIVVNLNFDPNVQVYFPRTKKATVMVFGVGLCLEMATQTAVSIFDLNLYSVVHRLCKFASTWLLGRRDMAFSRILVR